MTKFIGRGANWRVLLATSTLYAGLSTLGCSRNGSETVAVSRAPLTVSGLVAAYNFDQGSGTALTDLSGTGNNGTVAGPAWTTGIYGGALSFDGVNDWVTVADANSLDLTNGMTLEAWVNPAARNGWAAAVLKEGSNQLAYTLYANDDQSAPGAFITTTSGSGAATASGIIPLNQWSHIAATYDASTLKFYLNGALVDSQSMSGALVTSNAPLRLGGNSIWGDWFQGKLDDVRVYNRALSAAEISADMDTPIANVPADSTPPTVSLTGPSNGATLSGQVTISATASDNATLTGVHFFVDGVSLDNQDTSAPYAIEWNTRNVGNGSHTVSARARDAAGNATTASVTVTVQNGTSGLVAAYSFDEGSGTIANDASGDFNTGTVSGATWTSSGKHGGALSFDGIDDWVTVNGSGSLELTTGMTMEAWVRPSDLVGWACAVLKESTDDLAYGLYVNDNLDEPGVWIGSEFGTASVAGGAQVPLNTWTHLAATYDAATLKLYVNGVLAASDTSDDPLRTSSDPLRIGGNSLWGEWFEGLIDDVRIYNRALTASQIADDMATPVGTSNNCTGASIDDGNPCTLDACDPSTGVTHTPVASGTTCSDDNACNGTETCNGTGTCTNGTPPTVDDANPCTADVCDPVHGVTHTPVASGTTCSDGNACNGAEICNATGTCVPGTPVTCSALDQCHDVGTCNPATGACSNPDKSNGAACSDGDACTQVDTCQTGSCTGSNPVICTASDACHNSGTCAPATGQCSNPLKADGASCSDNNVCNGGEICSGGVCTAGTPLVIDDGNPCTADTCDPLSGVAHANVANGTFCSDGDLCNGAETCQAGSCTPGTPVNVDDGNPCTLDACSPISGVVTHDPGPNGTSCADANLCNGAETCLAGACAPGTPLQVDDGNPCTNDACDPATGTTHTPVAAGTSCSDQNACNGDEVCNGTTCTAGTAPTVDDGNRCTTDTCNPQTGVHHDPIVGCDPSPATVGQRFETRASIVGRVQDAAGAPVTNFTVQVFDAPPLEAHAEDPRSDITTTAAADGSFRTRLTTFPTTAAPGTPPVRVLVFVEGASFIRMSREAYLRPGDVADLGTFVVLPRDPNVTVIGASGGVATDSQNLVELTFPAGAVSGTVPVRITPITNREQFPNRLPDATATMYGVVLEPDGTTFQTPVTMRVANYRNVPTSVVVPHGVADEDTGLWLHEGFATWDGQRFRTTITHFSNPDLNASAVGELVIKERRWADGNKRGHVDCGVGSAVSVATGTLRQSIALPTYARQGRNYGITLTYDSGLTASRTPQASVPAPPAQAVSPSSFRVLVAGSSFRSECVVGGAGNKGGCGTGIPCSPGTWSAPLSITRRGLGTQTKIDTSTVDGTDSYGTGGYVDLPLNPDGSAPAPSYGRFEQTVTLGYPFKLGTGACLGSGFTFGVQGGNNPVPTAVPTGPQFRDSDYRLVYHRRGAAPGNGWGIAELNELFVAPDRSQVDLVTGNGNHEVFAIRPRLSVVSTDSALGTAGLGMATDSLTGETFVLAQQLGNSGFPESMRIFRVNMGGGVTAILSNLQIAPALTDGNDVRLAIAHPAAGRRFVVASATGLYSVNESGVVQQIAARTGSVSDTLERPSVAAYGPWVYYTTGLDDIVARANLDTNPPSLTPITAASGDIVLDPQGTASETQIQSAQGLATDVDGSLYVASPDRNVVYRLQAAADGSVDGGASVMRVIGDGSSSAFPAIGTKHPALDLGFRAPFEISVAPDRTVAVLSTAGVLTFDPLENTARWIIAGDTFQDREFLFFHAASTGEVEALGPSSFLIKLIDGLVRIDYGQLASEEDPTRTVAISSTGAVLTDTGADLVENYAFFDDFKGQARLTSRTGRSGEPLLTVAYSSGTKVDSLVDPTGGAFHFTYDGAGKLARVTDAAGRESELAVDGNGNLSSITLPTGEAWDFAYDATRMTSATNPHGGQSMYTYRSDGTLQSSTKPEGATTTLSAAINNPTYDSTGQLSYVGTMTNGHGVTQTLSTNAVGQLVRVQEAPDGVAYDSRVVFSDYLRSDIPTGARANSLFRVDTVQLNGIQLESERWFDDVGRLRHVYGPTTSNDRYDFAYRSDDRLQTFTHRAGTALNLEYDANGRLAHDYDTLAGFGPPLRDGREAFYDWRPDGQMSSLTAHGITTTLGYDAATGQLASVSDATGAQTFGHDAAGNVTSVSDGVTTTSFTYDSGNRLTEAQDALGNATTFDYDDESCGCSHGNLVTRLRTPDLPANTAWSFSYDHEGHLLESRDPLDQLAALTYLSTGEVATVTDRLGRTTSFSHDQQGRTTQAIDSTGRISKLTYPIPISGAWSGATLVAGSPNQTPAPTGLTDALGPGQYQVGYNGYPTVGRPPVVALYRDATFELGFYRTTDLFDQLATVQDMVGVSIASLQQPPSGRQYKNDTYLYDNRFLAPYVANSAAFMNNFQANDSFTRNTFADLTAADSPAQAGVDAKSNFNRDSAGRFISGNSTGSWITTDAHGSAIRVSSIVGSSTPYDSTTGYVTSHAAGFATRNLTYDARGFVREASLSYLDTDPIEGLAAPSTIQEGTFRYDYDQIGRNTRLEFPDGHVRVQIWDALGRLTSRCYNYQAPNPSRCYTATYDAVGNPKVLTDPEGTTEVDYDTLDRVTEVRRTEGGILVDTETYAYNALGGFSTYDGIQVNDQRTRVSGAGTAPAAVPASIAGETVQLDAAGRVTQIGSATISYDIRGRVSSASGVGTLYYDAFGRRIIGFSANFVSGSEVLGWDGANVAGSADLANQSGGGMNQSFIYDGIDQPLWMIDRNLFNVPRGFGVSGASVYFELDTLGNVRRLRGGLRASNRAPLPSDLGGYRYTAFGKLRPSTTTTPFPAVAGNTPPYRQPFLWQGRWAANPDASLYDFRTRFWSPELGAFLQPDEFQYLAPTGTLWSWAGQNPLRWRDPSGRLDPASIAAGIIAAGEAGAAWTAAAVGGAAVAAGGVGYALGYGVIGPYLFNKDDQLLNQRAKDEFEKAKERERQAGGGPADCPPETQSGGAGKQPPGPPRNATDTPDEDPDLDALSASGRDDAKNGLTRAGLEYQKHMGRGELPMVSGIDLNSVGQQLLDEILTNPQTTQSAVTSGNFPDGIRFIGPNGVGATFDANGVFRYFGIYP